MVLYTPIRNLPYVQAADTVTSYPTTSQDLATKLDQSGRLGYVQNASLSQTQTVAWVSLTGLTVTRTIPAGRLLRITAKVDAKHTAAGTLHALQVTQDGVSLGWSIRALGPANSDCTLYVAVLIAPAAGAHTYQAVAGNTPAAGTTTFTGNATSPAYILVEDIGAA